jgi:hypothetical protein
MTFHVLPDQQATPLTVDKFQRSAPMTFSETVSATPPSTMTLRILRVDDPNASASDVPDPELVLSAGGAPAVIPVGPASVSIADHNDTIVGTASYVTEPVDVFRIGVTVRHPGSTWTLQIQNPEDRRRLFTAVVADSDDDAQQPWIDATPELKFEAEKGSTAQLSNNVLVTNAGTGTLSVVPTGLTDPFLALPPNEIGPNGRGVVTIQYDPQKSGPRQQTLTLVSNDTTASTTVGHNSVVAVSYQDFPPPEPAHSRPCLHDDGCLQYRGPGNCRNVGCGHPDALHDDVII